MMHCQYGGDFAGKLAASQAQASQAVVEVRWSVVQKPAAGRQ